MTIEGRCFCGEVTWRHKGAVTRNLNCHCDECRRGVSGAFSAVAGLSVDGFDISGPWQDYRYTPESSRAFCTCCGTRIWFRSELWPDEIFVNVGALNDPEAHKPHQHVLTRETVPWITVADGIAASAGFQQPVEEEPRTTKGTAAQTELSGRCLCGEVHWTTDADPLWSGHCHCDSCRRATGAPFTSFFGVPRASVAWHGEMTCFATSEGQVERRFCKACGTHMSYQYAGWPDETHLYASALDDADRFKPAAHFHYAERLDWVHLADDLPRHPGSATAGEPTS